jgi:dynein heavy chain
MQTVPERLRGLCDVILLPYPSEAQATLLFDTILVRHYKCNENEDVHSILKRLPKVIWDLTTTCARTLVQSPARPHYVWTLRDAFAICRGVCMPQPTFLNSWDKVGPLFLHEANRVILDQLSTPEDRKWYQQVISKEVKALVPMTLVSQEIAADHVPLAPTFIPLNLPQAQSLQRINRVIGKDYALRGCGVAEFYVNANSEEELREAMCHLLEESEDEDKHADFVPFYPAIKSIANLLRIFRIPGQHVVLCGSNGCGKKLSARLAASLSDFDCLEFNHDRTGDSGGGSPSSAKYKWKVGITEGMPRCSLFLEICSLHCLVCYLFFDAPAGSVFFFLLHLLAWFGLPCVYAAL